MKYNEKALEEVLRNYPLLKAQAKVEEEELKHLFPACVAKIDDMPHGTGISDSTGDYAIKREARTPNIKMARAIEIAVEALTAREKDFVRLMYWEQWRRYQVCLRLGVRRTVLWQIQRGALNKIAKIILE